MAEKFTQDQTFDAPMPAPEQAAEEMTPESANFRISFVQSHKVCNAAELHALVFGSFFGRFEGVDVVQDYSGLHLIVPMANGQVGKVTISTVTDDALTTWKKSKTL